MESAGPTLLTPEQSRVLFSELVRTREIVESALGGLDSLREQEIQQPGSVTTTEDVTKLETTLMAALVYYGSLLEQILHMDEQWFPLPYRNRAEARMQCKLLEAEERSKRAIEVLQKPPIPFTPDQKRAITTAFSEAITGIKNYLVGGVGMFESSIRCTPEDRTPPRELSELMTSMASWIEWQLFLFAKDLSRICSIQKPWVLLSMRHEEYLEYENFRHILLVNDLEAERYMHKRFLESAKHFVISAESAEKALEKLAAPRTFSFDVVITDLHMPQMNGVLLAERVKQQYPDMPVILTAWDMSRYEGVQLPVDVALVQPFSISDLLKAVMKVTGQVEAPPRCGEMPNSCKESQI